MNAMPSIFISHGPPYLALADDPVTLFWQDLGKSLSKPDAIICTSAHWEAAWPMITGSQAPETIHDFGGPPALFDLSYPAPGDSGLVKEIGNMFDDKGFNYRIDNQRGIDHGVWVPLLRMFPNADIPVIQISIQTDENAFHHLEIGRILFPLRDRNILIMGSGGATHNLYEVDKYKKNDNPADYALEFDKWLTDAVISGNNQELLEYREKGPDAEKNHPFPGEHFLPLLVAAGASGKNKKGKVLHQSFLHGVLSMTAFMWD